MFFLLHYSNLELGPKTYAVLGAEVPTHNYTNFCVEKVQNIVKFVMLKH